MADFEYVEINATAEQIENVAKMDVDVDENGSPTFNKSVEMKDGLLMYGSAIYNIRIEGDLDAVNRVYVDEAVGNRVKKVKGDGLHYQVYAVTDNPYATEDAMLTIDTFGNADGEIPRRHYGNLTTNAPVADLDCANKKYVDDAVKNAGGGGGTGGGTTDYEKLDNKPKINNIELKGEMTANDLSLVDKGTFDKTIGDIETALDKIIEIQEACMNGSYVNGVTITDKTTNLNYKLYVDNEKLTMEAV